MVREFDTLPLRSIPRKPRVGLVGEILLKFHPDANNAAVDVIEAEGGEAVMPDLLDFFLYGFYDDIFRYKAAAGPPQEGGAEPPGASGHAVPPPAAATRPSEERTL